MNDPREYKHRRPAGPYEAGPGAACLTVCTISRQELGNSLIPETVKAGRQTEEIMEHCVTAGMMLVAETDRVISQYQRHQQTCDSKNKPRHSAQNNFASLCFHTVKNLEGTFFFFF